MKEKTTYSYEHVSNKTMKIGHDGFGEVWIRKGEVLAKSRAPNTYKWYTKPTAYMMEARIDNEADDLVHLVEVARTISVTRTPLKDGVKGKNPNYIWKD